MHFSCSTLAINSQTLVVKTKGAFSQQGRMCVLWICWKSYEVDFYETYNFSPRLLKCRQIAKKSVKYVSKTYLSMPLHQARCDRKSLLAKALLYAIKTLDARKVCIPFAGLGYLLIFFGPSDPF